MARFSSASMRNQLKRRANGVFLVSASAVFVLVVFLLFMKFYEPLLRFFLAHKPVFYAMPTLSVLFGLVVWLGFDAVFGVIPRTTSYLGMPDRYVRGTCPRCATCSCRRRP